MGLLVGVQLLEVYIGPFGVLLFQVPIFGVLVPEDEVEFVILSAFIRAKHDGVWRAVVELLLKEMVPRIRRDV